MADDRLAELVKRLQNATVDRRIQWEKTIKEGVYQVAFPDYIVELSTRPSSDFFGNEETLDYVLKIFDKRSSLIDEVADTDLAGSFEAPDGAFRIMRETYTLARRSAEGVDKAIDAILAQLEKPNDDVQLPF